MRATLFDLTLFHKVSRADRKTVEAFVLRLVDCGELRSLTVARLTGRFEL